MCRPEAEDALRRTCPDRLLGAAAQRFVVAVERGWPSGRRRGGCRPRDGREPGTVRGGRRGV